MHGPGSINTQFAGEFDFGVDAAENFNEMRLPWFDYWLKGIDTGIMDTPPVRKIALYSDLIHSFDWKSAVEHDGGV